MDEKDKEIYELKQERKLEERLDLERKESDRLYAIKLAERAIFALVALIAIGVASALIKVALGYLSMNGN